MTNQKSIKHKYAIYSKKMAGNVPSKTKLFLSLITQSSIPLVE